MDPSITNPYSIFECAVCGDSAHARPYAIFNCLSCLRFFRSNTPVSDEVSCRRNKRCPMTPKNRHRCRWCRYQKCLSVGMDPDDDVWTAISFFKVQYPVPEREYNNIVGRIVKAVEAIEYSNPVAPQIRAIEFDSRQSEEINRLNAWQTFVKEMDLDLWNILTFVKNLPKHDGLTSQQRKVQLKRNVFSIFLIRNLYSNQGILLANGCLVGREALQLLFGPLANKIMDMSKRISRIPPIDKYIFLTVVFYQHIVDENTNEKLKNSYQFYQNILNQRLTGDYAFENMKELSDISIELEVINNSQKTIANFLYQYNALFRYRELFYEMFGIQNDNQNVEVTVAVKQKPKKRKVEKIDKGIDDLHDWFLKNEPVLEGEDDLDEEELLRILNEDFDSD